MKVKIKHWHGVATWHWHTQSSQNDELCGICRVPFDGTCPNCKYPGDTCPLILGATCSHNFHLHCILKWLEQSNSKGLCPMCRQIFTAKVIEGIGSPQELAELQALIESHQNGRDAELGTDFEYGEN
ncbi:RING/U-box [Metschnikowia bicuspidata var. bicuspidata NRRL YB-4993]|uniref:Anaphase-promoting complex subunit 11 n=1 Tax=Metschnikowia bicuspidata var. bicuspidata NRRL YB-4993 TaxID=869754 RepID=A0A1A0HGF2_9ASCO|nr:RING/U-box [Metschnikowia bicuspidata var. bicuspidata NRRL YB-4993]OBA23070.1 RING/U-box [Metschnikowia bicuspidata var. bicuspidata NRRL YB-4993]